MQIFANTNFDFVGKRKTAALISGLLILIGMAALIVRGPNLSIDFKGGTLLQLSFEQPPAVDAIRATLDGIGLNNAEVQEFGTPNDFVVRVKESDEGQKLGDRLRAALKKDFPNVEFTREEMIGPKIGSELRDAVLLAILWAMVGIMVYIAWRFGAQLLMGILLATGVIVMVLIMNTIAGWVGIPQAIMNIVVFVAFLIFCWLLRLSYATAAIIALLHDVAITIGVFAVTGREISLSIIAALLTIIGYSLNDTIVVFDRIRENLRVGRKASYEETVNAAINQTLSRTLITSLTTLIVLVALFALGGEVIRDFILAMLVGVITGTYSSIFVASPVLVFWYHYNEKKKREALVKKR